MNDIRPILYGVSERILAAPDGGDCLLAEEV